MLSNPMPATVRGYSMKPHLALDIIQSLKPLWMLRFRELKLDLVLSGIFRIFV